MTLHQIKLELETAKHPVAKALHKGEHGRILAIGFKKDMVLKAHQAHLPSTLLVIEGKVLYKEGLKEIVLSAQEELQIPVNIIHDVTALENSICLLMQG